MRAKRCSVAAVLFTVMLTVLAVHTEAATLVERSHKAGCSLKLVLPASRIAAASRPAGPELLIASCAPGVSATLIEICGAESEVQAHQIMLTGGRHLYRLTGCPAKVRKETLSVIYN